MSFDGLSMGLFCDGLLERVVADVLIDKFCGDVAAT
jgi:hypothetical protein